MNEQRTGLHLPARVIPAPTTISPQAQAFLGMAEPMGQGEPDPADKAAWRENVVHGTEMLTQMMKPAFDAGGCTMATHMAGAVPIYEVSPPNMAPADAQRAVYYIHGGAYVLGYGPAAGYMAGSTALGARLHCFSVDYRMPPDYPFPTGLNDAVEGYRWMLERFKPEDVAIAGGSAGGGLAASLTLKLRDLGLPMPGAVVLATPESDLTESGDTFETNDTIDVVIRHRLSNSIALYADGHDLTDPYLSANFGDFSRGFPPTILTSGTRDLFLSNTVLLHRALRRAGVEAELHVWEAMPHGGFFGAPEDAEVIAEQARFIRERLGAAV